jgi:hypothetical protein
VGSNKADPQPLGSVGERVSVSGGGVDLAGGAIVHSEETTPTGVVKRLTGVVRLDGDLTGYVLYQPTQVFDTERRTLVVTGENVFSGTIAGSDPVVLRSDESRFEVDLTTGTETGTVHLVGGADDDTCVWYECELVVVGTGHTAEGDPTFNYSGGLHPSTAPNSATEEMMSGEPDFGPATERAPIGW